MKVRKGGIRPPISNQGVAELGHELGNVLNGLLGMTRLVRDSGLNAEQERWVRAIEHSGRQMRRLVDAFRREPVVAGEALRPEPVHLDGIEFLEQAVLAHAPSARERFDRLLLVADANLPRYWCCDPRLLRQVLDNLLGNALKFTTSGEVVLEAAAAREGGFPPHTLRLAVADSGPGIDPSVGERMFRAYERGGGSEENLPGGSGLGLFICHRTVEAMGGSIGWSDSDSGGARFELHLPGVLTADRAVDAALPTGLLQSVECTLDLAGSLRASVAGCLARLGVALTGPAWAAAPETDRSDCPNRRGGKDGRLRIAISELAIDEDEPGPELLLTATAAGDCVVGGKTLHTPVLECSLGPLLLELALEWRWFGEARGNPPRAIDQVEGDAPR